MDLAILIISLIRSGIKMATPLVMTSIGEIFAERSGVINIGLEGMMLTGALGGMLGSYFTGSPWQVSWSVWAPGFYLPVCSVW